MIGGDMKRLRKQSIWRVVVQNLTVRQAIYLLRRLYEQN